MLYGAEICIILLLLRCLLRWYQVFGKVFFSFVLKLSSTSRSLASAKPVVEQVLLLVYK